MATVCLERGRAPQLSAIPSLLWTLKVRARPWEYNYVLGGPDSYIGTWFAALLKRAEVLCGTEHFSSLMPRLSPRARWDILVDLQGCREEELSQVAALLLGTLNFLLNPRNAADLARICMERFVFLRRGACPQAPLLCRLPAALPVGHHRGLSIVVGVSYFYRSQIEEGMREFQIGTRP